MEKLNLKSYGWKCVLGAEVAYVACMAYAVFLSGKSLELHNALFELIPGFVWGNVASMVWGAVYMLIIAWVFAWYYVWMHNSSLESK